MVNFHSKSDFNDHCFFNTETKECFPYLKAPINFFGNFIFENARSPTLALGITKIPFIPQVESKQVGNLNLDLFFNILHTSNIERSVQFIDNFDIHSQFPHELWSFSENFATARIPYRDLEGEYEVSSSPILPDHYLITAEEWATFKINLQTSLMTLLDLSENPEVKNHDLIAECCAELTNKLLEISYNAEALAGKKKLSSEAFRSLKMENRLLGQLGDELRKIEKNHLLELLGHLTILTIKRKANPSKINGIIDVFFKIVGYPSKHSLPENAKSRKITEGLEKLRDYINLRSPRQKMAMSPGKMGVAEFIYKFCLKSLLPDLSDKEKYTKKMTESHRSDDRLVEIASARNIGGYHFVCDVLTDKGFATFDSMGTKKILGTSLNFQNENLAVSQSFYQSCKPLEFENVTVPLQKDNNCYLAAGWLKFCVFLHFFEQSYSHKDAF